MECVTEERVCVHAAISPIAESPEQSAAASSTPASLQAPSPAAAQQQVQQTAAVLAANPELQQAVPQDDSAGLVPDQAGAEVAALLDGKLRLAEAPDQAAAADASKEDEAELSPLQQLLKLCDQEVQTTLFPMPHAVVTFPPANCSSFVPHSLLW
jgi:hypothetical protein